MKASVLRNLLKLKSNSIARLISLSLGLAVGLLLLSYSSYELSYDRFQTDGDRIYRVELVWNIPTLSGGTKSSRTFGPMAEALEHDFPGVEMATCTMGGEEEEYEYQETLFKQKTLYADAFFFDLFSYDVRGENPAHALNEPRKLYLSESFAIQIYGSADAVGKTLRSEGADWTVAGTFPDIPTRTHLPFQVVKSTTGMELYRGWQGGDAFFTYARIKDRADAAEITESSSTWLKEYTTSEYLTGLELTELRDIYIQDNAVTYKMWLLGVLALIVILVAVVNYILLSVSTMLSKARLVGIHKVNGAGEKDIFRMFMWETGYLVIAALVVASGVLLLVSPWLETHLGLSMWDMIGWYSVAIVVVVCGILLLLAGIVPARIFARLPVMQSGFKIQRGSGHWKPFLLGTQFMMTAFLLAFLFILNGQYHLLLNKDLGYQPENLYFTYLKKHDGPREAIRLKEELLRLPFVKGVTLTDDVPYNGLYGVYVKGDEGESHSSRCLVVDANFFSVMGIPLLNRLGDFDTHNAVVVNEAFLEMMKRTSSDTGHFISEPGEMTICAVCRDFQVCHSNSRQLPLIMPIVTDATELADDIYVVMRLNRITPENLTAVKETMKRVVTGQHPELVNYADNMALQYAEILMIKDVVSLLVWLVILITLIGLTGYIADDISRRVREIALRKVNGATAREIILLLGGKALKIAMVAIVPGLIGAYWLGDFILQQYISRIPLVWWIFAVSALVTLSMAFFTVALCSYRTAREKPIASLRSE